MTVVLRAIERSELGQLQKWRNALLPTGTIRQWYPLAMADQERWFDAVVLPRRDHIMLAVAVDSVLAGVVGLTYCDWISRRCEASIYVGDEKLRGHGVGEAALRLLLDFGFKTVGMHGIYADILAHNTASIALFKKVGFVPEGLHRETYFVDGKWIDSWSMRILDREWR